MKTTNHAIGTAPACRRSLLNTGRILTTNMSQRVSNSKRITQGHKNTSPLVTIRCRQLNLHSRTATDNLMKLTEQDHWDKIFIQEPYQYKNRMVGLPKSSRHYTSPVDKSRTDIIITNNKVDAVLIKQLSNPDSVLIELKHNNKFFAASTYFDIIKELERELDKIEEILDFTKRNGLLIAVDSNSNQRHGMIIKQTKGGKY